MSQVAKAGDVMSSASPRPDPTTTLKSVRKSEDNSSRRSMSITRKPVPVPVVRTPSAHYHDAPSTPVSINLNKPLPQPSSARMSLGSQPGSEPHSRQVSQGSSMTGRDFSFEADRPHESLNNSTPPPPIPSRQPFETSSPPAVPPHASPNSNWPLRASSKPDSAPSGRVPSGGTRSASFGPALTQQPVEEQQPSLHYHHQSHDSNPKIEQRMSKMTLQSTSSEGSGSIGDQLKNNLRIPGQTLARPTSSYTLGSEFRGRTGSPRLTVDYPSPSGSPATNSRGVSRTRRSPDSRPITYIEGLHSVPYAQQIAPSLGNDMLRLAVGTNASLLDTRKTLEMYRQNVKKTTDPAVQYEFALFMVQAASEIGLARTPSPSGAPPDPQQAENTRVELLKEARSILHKLADRAYPFAQYYLGDGYASGLFNLDARGAHRGEPDQAAAFPLFVAASKHGHAEACYRAALCYEFGWGTRKDYTKAAQFYRTAASKGHPGAATRLGKACLTGDMGLPRGPKTEREGLKWLKRAAEASDLQYNAAPYELGLLHVTGFGEDVFKDEAYAAQLFTRAAELGHVEANLTMGEAYEHGYLGCPRDPALSVHFYNGAASRGEPRAMMALCAWYMVGAPPVLPKDESEAYEWARRAAEMEFAKAEYAVGYFTEMGVGCRRDPLEANVWYVRAADNGDERAKQRLAIIRAAASGDPGIPQTTNEKMDINGKQKGGLFGKLRGR